ncbi:hypothetical protein R1A27_29755 [Methylobacterium sp. NMS12]|uniref:DUF6894 family protein n=1 Tax=Methylobacterium sp. NMS12 TaxID=3079766 RepID=UPI003F8841D4
MAKRYFFDLVCGRRRAPDGDGILLSDPGAAKKYGTRLLAEHLVANAGERDQRLTMNVRDASRGMLFRLSMEMHVEMAAAGGIITGYGKNAQTRTIRPFESQA